MAADGEEPPPPPEETPTAAPEEIDDDGQRRCTYLQKFKLYETRSKFYMIGRGQSRGFWRVLKIDRLDPTELNVREDTTVYTFGECQELLRRIHEGNRPTGGLKFVTNCYGIVGFVKFLGPYYMLLITKRRLIGNICGHKIYAITKCRMITIPNPTVQPDVSNSKDENRYKKLLCTVDLTKDFFFSYSYHIMRSLQKNLCDSQKGQVVYETMFVWNEFLTRGIRNSLKSTLWIVALVYGFFKQAKLSTSGREFKLTLIARRSRHYAGTRFLKRGVNEKGRVANDVETEQIVFEEISGGLPTRISSVVQNRGSIPLFWSQETSKLNLKPDIVVHKKDQSYEATRLHFENLAKRYGNPIIILNLIKTRERKPRESVLRAEFANAIDNINKDLSKEDRLRFLHWDLSRQSRRKATSALELLRKVAANALNMTGFLYCQVTPALKINNVLQWPPCGEDEDGECSGSGSTHSGSTEISDATRNGYKVDSDESPGNYSTINQTFQRGVLRTNCIDCLDRTNVAQYAYGLVALGHQLHALDLLDDPKIYLDDPLADELMSFYEIMGDTLALQYTGSAAHNKIFCERRGHWKAAIQSQEFFRTLQRYYSNAYVDAEKQDAINVFLGHFQPQQGKPALWELDSDQHVGRQPHNLANDKSRAFFRRSLSDGNILCHDQIQGANTRPTKQPSSRLSTGSELVGESTVLFECTPDASTCESDISYSRYTAAMSGRQLFAESNHISLSEHVAFESNCSNFLDLDWLSSSGNSCEDEFLERSSMLDSPAESLSTENVTNGYSVDTASRLSEKKSSLYLREELSVESERPSCGSTISEHFVDWVHNGGTFYL